MASGASAWKPPRTQNCYLYDFIYQNIDGRRISVTKALIIDGRRHTHAQAMSPRSTFDSLPEKEVLPYRR